MEWLELTTEEEVNDITALSFEQPVVIFKHSTRCSISSMVKSRLERSVTTAPILFYYLDLIRYRNVSNYIASKYSIEHESPQALLIKNGECVHAESHMGISMEELEAFANQ
ncbi:bacillithiol system redox-active protein YtxJ [Chitinophaga skermanii]|nr:bacillithiol system redox-active protein YtxJ [Chitinophaga skermanii]